jgi:hypothetical protein
MKRLLAILAALACSLVLACGDDDADDDASDEEYFQQMDSVIVQTDESFFEIDAATAREALLAVADIFDETSQEFDSIEPPEDLAELHEQAIQDTSANAELLRDVASETSDDVPVEQTEAIFEEEPLASGLADDEDEPLCQLKQVAVEREIEVGDLGCAIFEDEGEDDEDEDDFEDDDDKEGDDEDDGDEG